MHERKSEKLKQQAKERVILKKALKTKRKKEKERAKINN